MRTWSSLFDLCASFSSLILRFNYNHCFLSEKYLRAFEVIQYTRSLALEEWTLTIRSSRRHQTARVVLIFCQWHNSIFRVVLRMSLLFSVLKYNALIPREEPGRTHTYKSNCRCMHLNLQLHNLGLQMFILEQKISQIIQLCFDITLSHHLL